MCPGGLDNAEEVRCCASQLIEEYPCFLKFWFFLVEFNILCILVLGVGRNPVRVAAPAHKGTE